MTSRNLLQGTVEVGTSQPEKLAAKIIRAGIPAGTPVLATIRRVHIEASSHGPGVRPGMVYFCKIKNVIPHQLLTSPMVGSGSYDVLPAHMVDSFTPIYLHDFRLPEEGYWTIHQVILMAVVAGNKRGFHVGMLPQTQVVKNLARLPQENTFHYLGAFDQ